MLRGGSLAVFEARTPDELHREVERFSGELGFQTYSAAAVIDHLRGDAPAQFFSVENTPEDYLDAYNDPARARLDPVMQHCKWNSVPLVWNQATYAKAGRADLWEQQAQFGYRFGITMAMHLPGGHHFVYGVERDQALPKCPDEMARVVASLVMFTVHAQDAAMRVLLPPSTQTAGVPALSPRELEVLRWTMDGKTAWEVGRILGISEDTVARHAHRATRKLECSSKHHAVVKALRLGLIQ